MIDAKHFTDQDVKELMALWYAHSQALRSRTIIGPQRTFGVDMAIGHDRSVYWTTNADGTLEVLCEACKRGEHPACSGYAQSGELCECACRVDQK